MPRLAALVAMIVVALGLGCGSPTSADEATSNQTSKPVAGDATCKVDADCAAGEACAAGLCQIQACATPPKASPPPLGAGVLSLARDLVVLASDGAVDAYAPTDGSFSHRASLDASGAIAVAGARFTAGGAESVVAATPGSSRVAILTSGARTDLDVGLEPIALGAGDVDGDGLDEIVAASAAGVVAICHAGAPCERHVVTTSAKDLAVADVDGDGLADVVLLHDEGGASTLLVAGADGAVKASLRTGVTLGHVAAGILDPTAGATILGLEDGGYDDFVSDTLHFFAAGPGGGGGGVAEIASQSVDESSSGLFAGDVDGDGVAEVIVLEGASVEVFEATGASSVASASKTTLTSTPSPSRLALADVEGNSATATLVGAPALVAGPVVPVSILAFPPYEAGGAGTSEIVVGSTDTKSTADASVVGLRAAIAVGFDASIPDVAKVSLTGRVEASILRTHTVTTSVAIGRSFVVDADPARSGPDDAAAVVATACFQAFTYAVSDPKHRLAKGADGATISVFVPAGGQTALWSLGRWNAYAAASGAAQFHVPYSANDPSSYPSAPSRLDGTAIADDDLVLAGATYQTSAVGRVGWSLDLTNAAADAEAETVSVSVAGQLGVGTTTVTAETGASLGSIYTVTLASTQTFSGSVPPATDRGFAFSPVVYRERYDARDSGLYVVTYAVSQ